MLEQTTSCAGQAIDYLPLPCGLMKQHHMVNELAEDELAFTKQEPCKAEDDMRIDLMK